MSDGLSPSVDCCFDPGGESMTERVIRGMDASEVFWFSLEDLRLLATMSIYGLPVCRPVRNLAEGHEHMLTSRIDIPLYATSLLSAFHTTSSGWD